MNRLTHFFAYHIRTAWVTALVLSLLVGLLVIVASVRGGQVQRLTLLQTEARRSSIEIMSSTLNGNLMGSITLLGLIDRDIKQEASNGLQSIDANTLMTLSTLGNSFGAEGVFVVGQDGIVKSSWDRVNKPSTGLDVRFRPYYQMAIKGQASVYAAISMARGDRSMYFAAPVYAEPARATNGIGAVVARTNLDQVDALLKGKFDQAMLLSPQGVVFAATNSAWIGTMEGQVTPERLKAIRELKQFGALFEEAVPKPLAISATTGLQTLEGRLFAVTSAPVQWNDPSGDWHLVVLENLGASVPAKLFLWDGASAALLGLLLGWMWIGMLRGRRVQDEAAHQLKIYAQQQEAQATFRSRLAQTSVRLQRCETPEDLSQVFFGEASALFGVVQGAAYIVSQDDPLCLNLVGTRACAQAPPAVLSLGVGLLGQCAKERHLQLIAMPDDGFWSMRSGLGNSRPAALLLLPMALHDTLIGVVELAFLQIPPAQTTAQLEELVAMLTNSMEILRRNLLLQKLAPVAGQRDTP
jgi:two-component system C4-dicarboxylate transport sensor histidine kinase DctB